MSYLVICSVATLASCLTFFSGFGLGTLLLPAFALFFQVELAVALTAVVHFLNGSFKLALVWRHVDRGVVLRFGLTAILGALAGAWLLTRLADAQPLYAYSLAGRHFEVMPAKLIVGLLLLLFACAEISAAFRRLSFPPRLQPLGGLVSGFFGGLAGMQGALRSAFLVKAGLDKAAYVATGAAVAFLIDLSRLAVYARLIHDYRDDFDDPLLAAAVLAALCGSLIGSRYLHKSTMAGIQKLVAALLFVVALGLIGGWL
jgi:uncharacterized membrane protein YfcA